MANSKMDPIHVEFKIFDFASIAARLNILAFGKRNSGKTNLGMNILLHMHKHYPVGCAITPTASVQMELAKHMPSSLVWSDFDLDKLKSVVSKFTQSLLPNWMSNVEDSKKPNVDIINWLLYMDDVGYNEKMFTKETFKEMYMNGRQIGLGTLLNLQKLKSIPPALRGQLDLAFFFRDNSKTVQESIHRDFFSFLTFQHFREIYLKCTEGYNCLVLDIIKAQRTRDLGYSPRSLTECIFICMPKRIEELPPFQMFHPFVWKLDIAWKRVLKRRSTLADIKEKNEEPPRSAVPFHVPDIRELSIIDPPRYSNHPQTTFSSLRSIPTPQVQDETCAAVAAADPNAKNAVPKNREGHHHARQDRSSLRVRDSGPSNVRRLQPNR